LGTISYFLSPSRNAWFFCAEELLRKKITIKFQKSYYL